jgi:putative tricarboxylic transport membrane protein
MTIRRRTVLAATAGLAAAGVLGRSAAAQQRFANMFMFIPAGPGGGWDGLGRAIEQVARTAGLVGNFQFENVGGAGGMVGLPRFVSQRRGRGEAILVGGSVMVGAGVTNRSPVTIKDVVPIARMTEEVGVVVVPSNSEFRDIGQLIAALRANPGAVSIGGGSAGGTDQILAGLLAQAAGIDPAQINYIPYSGGGESLSALLGGQVTAGISGTADYGPQVASGDLKGLAVSTAERSDQVPDVPTLVESGFDVEVSNWRGVMGRPDMSDSAREDLIALVVDTHDSDEWAEALENNGWDDLLLTGDDYGDFLAAEETRVREILVQIGLIQ